jgi:hypothetical protein
VVIGVYRGGLTIAGDARALPVTHRQALPNKLTFARRPGPAQTLRISRSARMAQILRSDKFHNTLPYRLTAKFFGESLIFTRHARHMAVRA